MSTVPITACGTRYQTMHLLPHTGGCRKGTKFKFSKPNTHNVYVMEKNPQLKCSVSLAEGMIHVLPHTAKKKHISFIRALLCMAAAVWHNHDSSHAGGAFLKYASDSCARRALTVRRTREAPTMMPVTTPVVPKTF